MTDLTNELRDEWLTPRQREHLMALAGGLGFSHWDQAPPLADVAKKLAVINEGTRLQRIHPDWGRARCLDEAESRVLGLLVPGRSTSSALARWSALSRAAFNRAAQDV